LLFPSASLYTGMRDSGLSGNTTRGAPLSQPWGSTPGAGRTFARPLLNLDTLNSTIAKEKPPVIGGFY
jgi:hypothetical protein